MDRNLSRIERLALQAEDLDAFTALKLMHIKEKVSEALALVGRDGFFAEYTRHDISHIDHLLAETAWIIPETTWQHLTPLDGLIQTLAIYFHDLGMLVTEREYEKRDRAGLERFKERLFAGAGGADYRAKVSMLGPDRSERFLYQEFVRAHHGERIRAWISGSAPARLGAAEAQAREIARLLHALPAALRDDLGLVCESHHRDDLDRVDLYLVSRPYGPTPEHTANIQYASIILRTVDLLHITADRTPSLTFRLISPSDPVSQQEWAKQQAVTAVRPKPGVDDEGNVDYDAPQDTVEIFAEFSDEEGFFGLTEYLGYVARQLQQSHNWAETSRKRHGSLADFPWRRVDESHIRTKGFIRDSFEFTFDQGKVLDLLTGHTLYNNTNVVLRELVQNSLDAVRLQALERSIDPDWEAHIEVRWDPGTRVLSVADNGTGMSQQVIEAHFLKVGASRYQDPEFKRRYPDFSPISRFGIGVLSAFMIADAITITTLSSDDDYARRLSLRSVHGRYLIRLLDRDLDPEARSLAPHGTTVELRLRPSARIADVETVLRRWIVIPRCRVTLTVVGEESVSIGHDSPKAALAAALSTVDTRGVDRTSELRIEEYTKGSVTMAYALRWSELFKEWQFVIVPREQRVLLGTCIEGVGVEFGTPGYQTVPFAALVDARGGDAPRTDVARSGLEDTPERDRALQEIYDIYCDHVRREVQALVDQRGFSLTWAAQEARWLTGPLFREPSLQPTALVRAAADLPVLVIDEATGRRLATPAEMFGAAEFWTVHSAFYRSAELLLREIPTTASVGDLSKALHESSFHPPDGPVLTMGDALDDPPTNEAFREKDVAQIVFRRGERRVDFAWRSHDGSPRWRRLQPDLRRFPELRDIVKREQYTYGGRRAGVVVVPVGHIEVVGGDGPAEAAVMAERRVYLLPRTPLSDYVVTLVEAPDDQLTREDAVGRVFAEEAINAFLEGAASGDEMSEPRVRNVLRRLAMRSDSLTGFSPRDTRVGSIAIDDFAVAISSTRLGVFDPYSWERRATPEDDDIPF